MGLYDVARLRGSDDETPNERGRLWSRRTGGTASESQSASETLIDTRAILAEMRDGGAAHGPSGTRAVGRVPAESHRTGATIMQIELAALKWRETRAADLWPD